MVTEKGCGYLSSALRTNPSHLRELDLSYNHPGPSGVQLLNHKLEDPNYKLETLNLDHQGESMIKAGPQKYACDLTLDPNTANAHLILSDDNRKAEYVKDDESNPDPKADHPDRFEHHEQVLCVESLTGRCYWEAEWSGFVEISVTHRGINRKGGNDSWFGYSGKSWSLYCSAKGFTAWHNNESTDITDISLSNRVGVYVDVSAGSLSFYGVSDTHTLTHLHTFNTTFTEPLCAGFGVHSDSTISYVRLNHENN
ncbi:stonustoxin subunit beta-like [Cyprinus carpio]|uniref:Stonustoxin subunit beta-like n=1 Tax=Cyprinus carpio TaxID=7962 RepID=A0A9Q9VYE3_CYPCA|nr:stonustoxin subunit beta-like [Cyprinus carpio]